tara:strand:- start:163 stop:366 length:204 start_codon:yes stop_codon:yes gene_type:complete
MNRPNILFAIADDASYFSAYGHQFVDTPAFDRVAREGVMFANVEPEVRTVQGVHPDGTTHLAVGGGM